MAVCTGQSSRRSETNPDPHNARTQAGEVTAAHRNRAACHTFFLKISPDRYSERAQAHMDSQFLLKHDLPLVELDSSLHLSVSNAPPVFII
jgi:hypothetical protein